MALAVMAAVVGTTLVAQRPPGQAPPRDPRPATGTSVIRGRVVDAENGLPIRRAIVRASSESLPQWRVSSTDSEGRYEFRELPPGSYTLTASKGAYVTVSYGQRRPNERGKSVDIGSGQVLERIDFNLPRGAIVSGRIYDEFGEAMAGARVQAMRYRFQNGERRLQGSGRSVQTDDRGEFRLFGLPPGEYVISAEVPPYESGTDDRLSYAPTYYPGTSSAAEAQRVTLAVGQEASANFSLLLVPTAIVRGLALASNGRPLMSGSVSLQPESRDVQAVFGPGGSSRIEPDGTFRISNVAPGDYILEVRTSNNDDDTAEFASMVVNVTGADVSGLVVRTTPGATASGVIVFDPAAPANLNPRSMRVYAPSTLPRARGRTGRARINNDWTFEIGGLLGERLIRLDDPPDGWSLKRVLLNGRDVTDTPTDFSRGERVESFRVIMTNQATRVSGAVMDTGKPVRDYVAVIFADDSNRWRPPTRFVVAARPNQDGRFEIRGLPAARYLAVAVDYLETGEEQDSSFLQQIQPMATPVLLGEGGVAQVTLRLVSRGF